MCRWHIFSGDLGGYAGEGKVKQKLNEKEILRPKSEVFGSMKTKKPILTDGLFHFGSGRLRERRCLWQIKQLTQLRRRAVAANDNAVGTALASRRVRPQKKNSLRKQ